MYQIMFIHSSNKQPYQTMLFNWLQSDFKRRRSPVQHFWHNREIITQAFDRCQAMVVTNDQKIIVGYMTWKLFMGMAEIDIVEVSEIYRQQGIFKQMLSVFVNKFAKVVLLSATVLPQSEIVFQRLGWESMTYGFGLQRKKFFKIIRPVLKPMPTLPGGRVIAICPDDFYAVCSNPDQYATQMQYFQIDVDRQSELTTPIVTKAHHECYMAFYFNKTLIVEGKPKHLLKYDTYHAVPLMIERFDPIDPTLFIKLGINLDKQLETLSDNHPTKAAWEQKTLVVSRTPTTDTALTHATTGAPTSTMTTTTATAATTKSTTTPALSLTGSIFKAGRRCSARLTALKTDAKKRKSLPQYSRAQRF